jgi:hypothetical protein
MDDVSEKDAFKLGFLARCAEEQLVGAELETRIKRAGEKQSVWPVLAALGVGAAGGAAAGRGATGGLKDLLSAYGSTLETAGAAGLAGGAGLGYGLAHATTPNISDDEIRAQELAQTYRVYADRARSKNRAKKKYRVAR